MQLISPMKQRVWHWPAVANFFLGGMAGGLYLIQSVLTHFVDMAKGNSLFVKFTLVASALILLGLLLVGLEAGRPSRGLHVFRELRRSWMSREAWAAVVFVPAAILNCIIPNPVVLSLAICAAFFFMVSQGLIVYSARGVTAWNVPIIPLFFISSGLATGSGLFLLLTTVAGLGLNKTVVAISICSAGLNILVWFTYLKWSKTPEFLASTERLRRPVSMFITLGLGHLLPLIILLPMAMGLNELLTRQIGENAAAFAGLLLIWAGMLQKSGLILKTGYFRGIGFGE